MLFGRKYFIARALAADSEARSSPLWYLIRRQTEEGTNAYRRIAEEFYAAVVCTAPNWASGGGPQKICL